MFRTRGRNNTPQQGYRPQETERRYDREKNNLFWLPAVRDLLRRYDIPKPSSTQPDTLFIIRSPQCCFVKGSIEVTWYGLYTGNQVPVVPPNRQEALSLLSYSRWCNLQQSSHDMRWVLFRRPRMMRQLRKGGQRALTTHNTRGRRLVYMVQQYCLGSKRQQWG